MAEFALSALAAKLEEVADSSRPALELGGGGETVWEHTWSPAMCSYMAHHRVACTPLAPGTGYLCMVREAVTATEAGRVQVTQAQFTAMMFLDGPCPVVRVGLESEGDQSTVVSIKSSVSVGDWTQHAAVTATVQKGAVGSSAPLDVAALAKTGGPIECMDGASFYASTGNDYRGDFRAMVAVWTMGTDNGRLVTVSNLGALGVGPETIPEVHHLADIINTIMLADDSVQCCSCD